MEFKVGDRVRHTWMYKNVDKGTVVSIHPQACEDGGYCLVKFDNGEKLSIRDGQAEILKEETMETQTVYKALVRTKDGRLVSIWAETLLDYHEGEVTYAPKGSMGIFISPTLWGARDNGKMNSRHRCIELKGTLVVHEATPLGNLCSKAGDSAFRYEDRYPAILLGKEVWNDKPKEEWVDVTKECMLQLYWNGDVAVIELRHQGKAIATVGTEGFQISCRSASYKVEKHKKWQQSDGIDRYNYWFKILKKVMK